jgi:hypothetical protein
MAETEGVRAPIETVLAEFDGKKELLSRLCETTKRLIEKSLEASGLHPQYVQARVKTREKLKTKYLDPNKNYSKLDDITDQGGLRVITYYEDEVDRVAKVVKKEFAIDEKNSVDKREVDSEKFGYYALNYVCTYLESRTSHIGKVEERSSSRSRYPSTARYAATSAILTAISSKSDRAPTSRTVNAGPGWDADLNQTRGQTGRSRCAADLRGRTRIHSTAC